MLKSELEEFGTQTQIENIMVPIQTLKLMLELIVKLVLD